MIKHISPFESDGFKKYYFLACGYSIDHEFLEDFLNNIFIGMTIERAATLAFNNLHGEKTNE